MNLLSALFLPLVRGAAVAALFTGIADSWAVALGGAADLRALATGAMLIAIGWGACHRGTAKPPARASFLWLAAGGLALPLLSPAAPWAGLAGCVLILPLRVLGARLSALLATSARPSLTLTVHAAAAFLGVAFAERFGLGLGGFALVAALAGMTTAGTAQPPEHPDEQEMPTWERITRRTSGLLLGAGLAAIAAALWPMLRAFDASDAASDAQAMLALGCVLLIAWLTIGVPAAESRWSASIAALFVAATGLLLPFAMRNWAAYSQPLAFDGLLRMPALRSFLGFNAPRLPEAHFAYVPLLVIVGAGLMALMAGAGVRAWLGRRPDGPFGMAPLFLGAGFMQVVLSLPAFDAPHASTGLVFFATLALIGAALSILVAAKDRLAVRIPISLAIGIAALMIARPALVPDLAFPVQDVKNWRVASTAEGVALATTARDVVWRVVEPEVGQGFSGQFLAAGRNLVTPELDEPGTWVRELDLALALRPGARRALFVGPPHPASLRAAARTGVREAELATPSAAADLLALRNPQGYGLALSHCESLARSHGEFDLIVLRSLALWDESWNLLRVGTAAQAARRLAPGGICVLALAPEQLPPGALPGLIGAWGEIFYEGALYAVPDGLRGVRLLLVGAKGEGMVWPDALEAMRLPHESLRAVAHEGRRSHLASPLPRLHAELASTVWRLVDELQSTRRAAEVLAELAPVMATESGAPPPPSLLRFYALHYAAQEYSTHDTLLVPGPDAIEVDEQALTELLRLARSYPDAQWMHALWSDVAGTLAAKREVELVETFLRPLREEIGWKDSGITLALARASAEMLDDEDARALLADILEREPEHAGALALLKTLDEASGLAPDAHAGHGHD